MKEIIINTGERTIRLKCKTGGELTLFEKDAIKEYEKLNLTLSFLQNKYKSMDKALKNQSQELITRLSENHQLIKRLETLDRLENITGKPPFTDKEKLKIEYVSIMIRDLHINIERNKPYFSKMVELYNDINSWRDEIPDFIKRIVEFDNKYSDQFQNKNSTMETDVQSWEADEKEFLTLALILKENHYESIVNAFNVYGASHNMWREETDNLGKEMDNLFNIIIKYKPMRGPLNN